MENQIEERNTEMGTFIGRSEEFIQQNRKSLTIAVVAIVVVAVAVFGAIKWYFQPRETRAAEAMFAAEQWFAVGDYDKALNGDEAYDGFLAIIDGFGGTDAANLAKYYAGCSYLRLENYEEAIHWLKKYNGKDTFTRPLAEMLIGDAQMELDETADAAKHYVKAAQMEANIVTTPTALFKAGMAYLKLGENGKALNYFNQVKLNYPESSEWRDIDRYIAIAEAAK
ncbi:MAG: tetratricopeptide repeat protein [Bacteroidales bacterium]|nr:tetratricopeptide repeat protein [Bacteroidales bacterium]